MPLFSLNSYPKSMLSLAIRTTSRIFLPPSNNFLSNILSISARILDKRLYITSTKLIDLYPLSLIFQEATQWKQHLSSSRTLKHEAPLTSPINSFHCIIVLLESQSEPSRLSAFSSLSCHTASSLLQKLYTFVSLKDMNFFFFQIFLQEAILVGILN